MAARARTRPIDLRAYLRLTRGVTVSIAYLLPLLAAYEAGLLLTGSALRNSAELSLKHALGVFGAFGPWIQHAVFLGTLVVAVRLARRDVPAVRLYPAFLLEALLFALLLGPAVGVLVDWAGLRAGDEAPTRVERLLLSVGAGVYEELLFRFLLFAGGFAFLHRGLGFPRAASFAAALVVSALLFGAYHHVGEGAEPFSAPVFAFRTVAGAAFALLFAWRGLALCAYLHAFYDILCDLASDGAAA